MKEIKSYFIGILVLFSLACHIKPKEPTVSSIQPAEKSTKILLVADNQEHHLVGGDTLKSVSSFVDRLPLTGTSLRHPFANIGGRFLLEDAIKSGKENGAELILHLGDASDISCKAELIDTLDVLESSGLPWFFTPGNHDGFLSGNFSKYQPTIWQPCVYQNEIANIARDYYKEAPSEQKGIDDEDAWRYACLSLPDPVGDPLGERSDILTKGDAIEYYIKILKNRSYIAQIPYDETKPAEVEVIEEVEFNVDKKEDPVRVPCRKIRLKSNSGNYEVIARICPRHLVPGKTTFVGPWASYIVQRLTVGNQNFLLIDTSAYQNPKSVRSARFGSLYDETIDAKSLIKGISRQNLIIIGHHPFNKIFDEDRKWILNHADRYISAHTHNATNLGYYDYKDLNLKITELNVGSTLDYPPQAALLAVSDSKPISVLAFGECTNLLGFVDSCPNARRLNNCIDKSKREWRKQANTYNRRKIYTLTVLTKIEEGLQNQPSGRGGNTVPDGNAPGDWAKLDDLLKTIRSDPNTRNYWKCKALETSEPHPEGGRAKAALVDGWIEFGIGPSPGIPALPPIPPTVPSPSPQSEPSLP